MTAYQVLARKWRPKTFADLVGQQHVVKALQNALDKGRLHHAYLLTGTRGVGKTTIARILAKSLNCENAQHGEPCGVCQSCRDIDAGRFVDLLEIDAASNTGIDNIREVLENAQYAPTVGKYKVYIIDEVHMLSKSAFNAMLKTLEEPPEHVKFILATTDPHKVPITVLSRCLQFVLRNLTPQQVTAHLTHVLKTEQIVYEPNALALLGYAAQGSMRDALSLLDQAIAMGSGSVQERDVRDMIGAVDKRYLYELLTFLMEQDGENLIKKAQEMASNAIGFDGVLNDLAMLLQRLALIKTVPTAISTDDPEYEYLLQLANYFSDEQIQLYYQCAIHGKQDLSLAPDEYAGFVMTLLRMLAFAPFTAKNTPINSKIEGTQLHSHEENSSATKPTLPEKYEKSTAEFSGSLKTHTPTIREFQPQELPPPHPAEIKREFIKPTDSHQEKIVDDADTPPWSDDVFSQPKTKLPPQLSRLEEINHVKYHDDIPFEQLSTTPPTNELNELTEINTQSNEPPQPPHHAPMPELTRENWLEIVARIGHQVAAAQMILHHLAWVNYADGVLELALMQDKTRGTVKKEYFDRIASTLSANYNTPIKVQTQNWQDGMNWETPAMYRDRIAQDKHERAKQALLNDAVVQQLMSALDAQLIEKEVELKE